MPFTRENARRLRGRGGRKKLAEHEKTKFAAEIVRQIIEAHAKPIALQFVKRAQKSDRVLIAAVDKLLPEINRTANERPIAIQIIIESPNNQGTNGAAHPDAEGDSKRLIVIET